MRRKAGLLLLGLGVGLLATEIALRLVPGWLPFEVQPEAAKKRWDILPTFAALSRLQSESIAVWEKDDTLRDHLKPGVDTILHGNPEFPDWRLRTNSLGLGPAGFRDTLPAGSPYAIVLGDSFGFGVGVAQAEVWSEVLERETGLPFVNLSQPGASSLQEALIYARYGRRLPAKIVFSMFFENDLKENLRFARWLHPEANIIPANSQPTQNCSGPFFGGLKRYSIAYELLAYALRACEYSALPPRLSYRDEDLSLVFCRDYDICNLPTQARMISDGWPLTRQAFDDTLAQTKQAGSELVIVIVPSKEQVYWTQLQETGSFPAGHNIDQLVEPVREYCAREQLRCIDLTAAFRAGAKSGEQLYFRVDIHWNAHGHALAARVIREYLREAELLP